MQMSGAEANGKCPSLPGKLWLVPKSFCHRWSTEHLASILYIKERTHLLSQSLPTLIGPFQLSCSQTTLPWAVPREITSSLHSDIPQSYSWNRDRGMHVRYPRLVLSQPTPNISTFLNQVPG